jgi:hypothetical protein
LADDKRVVADDALPLAGNEGAGRAGGLGMSRVAEKPGVKRVVTAAEALEAVLAPQGLGPRPRRILRISSRRSEH